MTEQSTSGYAPPPPPPPPPSGSGYAPPPPPGAAPPRQPLRRSPAGRRVLGGVATGLADFFGIDPILVRVGFVVLTVLSGGGIVLYLALWLFLPEEGEPDSAGERFLHNNTALAATLAVVLGLFVVAPVLAWGWWGKGPGFLGLIVTLAAAAVVVAVARRDQAPVVPSPSASTGQPPAHSPQPTAAPMATTTAAATITPTQVLPYAPPAVAVEPPASGPSGWRAPTASEPPRPPKPPKPPKQRSVLGPLTVSVALLVVGVLVALDLAGVANLTAVTVVSAALLAVGLGLLVGTILGRSRGLIALGVVLVLLLVPLAAIPRGLHAGDGAGDRAYTPTTLTQLQDEYRLGAGQLTLDLSNLDLAGTTQQVDVQVGAGLITVLLPRDASAAVDARAGVGNLQLPGQPNHGGIGVDQTWSRQADGATGSLELDLQVGLGEVQVNVTRPSIDSTHAEVTR